MSTVASAAGQADNAFQLAYHKVVAVYQRENSFTVETTKNADFIFALRKNYPGYAFNATSADGLYLLRCEISKESPGADASLILSVQLNLLAGKGDSETYKFPVKVVYTVQCRYGDNQDIKGEGSHTGRCRKVGTSAGTVKLMKVEDIRSDPDFQANQRLVLDVKVKEKRESVGAPDLSSATIPFKKAINSLAEALTVPPDLRVLLEDGELVVAEKLFASCDAQLKAAITNSEQVPTGEEPESQRVLSPRPVKVEEDLQGDEASGSKKRRRSVSSRSGQMKDVEPVIHQCYGRVLRLPAFSTTVFKAFMGYLKTQCVNFAPLYPDIDPHVPETLLVNAIFPDDWSCSPKSLHSFASAYNNEDLVKKCEAAYAALLRPKIALLELADKFARTHPSVLAVVEKYALANWTQISALPDFEEHMKAVMEHEESRNAFFRILKKMREV